MSGQWSIRHGRTHENGPFYPRQLVPPGGMPSLTPPAELTGEQVDRFRAEWLKAQRGEVKILTPLPRRVRLRLAIESAVNHAGTWLVYHGHHDAARRLWRTCGMWGK